jgi:hypothetical protein
MNNTEFGSYRFLFVRPDRISIDGRALVQIGDDCDPKISSRDNSPLSEWIAQGFAITVFSATERILDVFAREAKAL